MKLPVDGQWAVRQNTDRGLALLATKNIQFDQEGYATLANRTIDVFDEGDSSSFRDPIGAYTSPAVTKLFGTSNAPFSVDIGSLPVSISIDGLATQPSGSSNSSQAYFVNRWTVSTTAGFRYYNGSAWTDPSPSLTSGVRHPLCVHKGNNTLLVGNGAQVKQFNTSYSETTNLSLPTGIEVVGIAYNRSYACIITWDSNNREAWVYLWDGATAGANYAFPLGSNRAWFVASYGSSFTTITGLGEILTVDTDGTHHIGGLPAFFTSAIMSDIDDRIDIAHDTAILVDGERLLFQIKGVASSKNSETNAYNPLQPAGIWCWDPKVGLYHRHAPSGAKLNSQNIATANVNTGTDVITGVSIPATGTPFVYVSLDGTNIGGLTPNTIYYVINLSSTTFKVASTRALALAGTPIDLTSAASGFSYKFAFFPESDYGQTGFDGYAGLLGNTGPAAGNSSSSFFTLFQKFLYGHVDVPHNAIGDGTDSFGFVMDRSENRGWMLTQKMFSPNVQDKFEKFYLKLRNMLTENDKVIVKYRTSLAPNFPQILRNSTTDFGTWSVVGTTSMQFTTTADMSNLKTAFDASSTEGAYEIEIIGGAGSGYLAHITAITLNAGTYTITIDEPVRNVAVNDTFWFVVDNFLKLSTKGNLAYVDSAADPNYSEFPIGKGSKWIQFKIELRGFRVGVEEMEIVNTSDKPPV